MVSRTHAEPRAQLQGVLEGSFSFLVAAMLFGDYLALSVSRALTGNPGNWILCTGALQLAALALAAHTGRLRGKIIDVQLVCLVTLGAIALLHVVDHWMTGVVLDDYAVDKVIGLFGLGVPSLLLGIAIGRSREFPGARWLYVMLAPLLAASLYALATDPEWITIAYFDRLVVVCGIFVLPAHQALAYVLSKSCLMLNALACGVQSSRCRSGIRLVVIGTLVALTLLSGARGYSVALCAALFVQCVLRPRKAVWMVVVFVLAAAMLRTFASDLIAERFDVNRVGESLSYLEREDMWRSALAAFLDRPLFGQGPGGFALYFHHAGRTYPHNLVLEVASEFGCVGLTCVCVMIGSTLVRVVRHWRSGAPWDSVQLFAVGMLCYALVGSMSVGDLIRNHFLFFALGMTEAALRGAPARSSVRVNTAAWRMA